MRKISMEEVFRRFEIAAVADHLAFMHFLAVSEMVGKAETKANVIVLEAAAVEWQARRRRILAMSHEVSVRLWGHYN